MKTNVKKILTAAAAVLILTMTGCGSAPEAEQAQEQAVTAGASSGLETQETQKAGKEDSESYMKELRTNFNAYSESTQTFTEMIKGKDFDSALKAIDNAGKALDSVENMSAPEKFSELHKKLTGSIVTEREFLNDSRKLIECCQKYEELKAKTSPTEEDMQAAQELSKEVQELAAKAEALPSEFPSLYTDTIRAVKADIDS